MKYTSPSADALRSTEPRWPAVVATFALAAIHYALPDHLTLGPSWLVPFLIFLLLIPAVLSHRAGKFHLNATLGMALLSVITIAEVWSLALLIRGLPDKDKDPLELARSAALLWVGNVLVFASWYWRLDAGGPHARDLREEHAEGAFLFPHMTIPDDSEWAKPNWKPGFVDYLFLAFNTSVAFSPTDTPVLSRWAKMAMIIQACVLLSIIAILAARAISLL
ncbi:MAG: hypothetical protein ACJ746_11970 [Bryobacteraceae bacterium]